MNIPKLPSFGGEDYNYYYGHVDYTNKVVLDIGADYGSTAYYFLSKGAKLVIAIESNPHLYERLRRYADKVRVITPIRIHISNNQQIEDLLVKYKPDIVKFDCEGCERHLLEVDNSIFIVPSVYIVECHTNDIIARFKNKLTLNNYKITHVIDNLCNRRVKVIYGVKS